MNQAIRVNTTADEVFTHDIGRDVDDLINVMEECEELSKALAELEKLAKEMLRIQQSQRC